MVFNHGEVGGGCEGSDGSEVGEVGGGDVFGDDVDDSSGARGCDCGGVASREL
jgi:hypothetical protein